MKLTNEIRNSADAVKELTIEQVKSLPNMLGRIASAMVSANGFYAYTDLNTRKKVLIVLKVAPVSGGAE
jgi:hypothetical protein